MQGMECEHSERRRDLPSSKGRESTTMTEKDSPRERISLCAWTSTFSTTDERAYVRTTSPSLIFCLANSTMTSSARVTRSRMYSSILAARSSFDWIEIGRKMQVDQLKFLRQQEKGCTDVCLCLVDGDDGDLVLEPSDRVPETDGHGSSLSEVGDLWGEMGSEVSREGRAGRSRVRGNDLSNGRSDISATGPRLKATQGERASSGATPTGAFRLLHRESARSVVRSQTDLLKPHESCNQPRVGSPDLSLPELKAELDDGRVDVSLDGRGRRVGRLRSGQMGHDQMRSRSCWRSWF